MFTNEIIEMEKANHFQKALNEISRLWVEIDRSKFLGPELAKRWSINQLPLNDVRDIDLWKEEWIKFLTRVITRQRHS